MIDLRISDVIYYVFSLLKVCAVCHNRNYQNLNYNGN
jgi:hypothetical protein